MCEFHLPQARGTFLKIPRKCKVQGEKLVEITLKVGSSSMRGVAVKPLPFGVGMDYGGGAADIIETNIPSKGCVSFISLRQEKPL